MKNLDLERRDLMLRLALFGFALPFPAVVHSQPLTQLVRPRDVQERLKTLTAEARADGLLITSRQAPPALNTKNFYLESLPLLVEIIDQALPKSGELAGKTALLLNEVTELETSRSAVLPGLKERAAAPPFQSVKDQYLKQFDELIVRPAHIGRVKWHVDRLVKNRPRYELLTADTGVPWFVVGVTHALEASFNFLGHLHNGDVPLNEVTRQVPANRPAPWEPPFTWERSAIDALRFEKLANLTNWSLPWTLYRLEKYNGFGYRSKRINSPYLWSFSNHYNAGKFVKDGKWSTTAVSQQCGAAVMIHELVRRGTISF
jgi:lysozyme family protein